MLRSRLTAWLAMIAAALLLTSVAVARAQGPLTPTYPSDSTTEAFVEGQSLRQHIHGHPLEVRETLDIAIQVAEAVEAAHHKGTTHRDIKSSNIIIKKSNVLA